MAARTASAAPRTMRVDYYHTGNATEERFALDRVVLEPLEWPGNPARPIDDTNLGKYFFEVIDRKTNRVLYSRGFASVYGEWETTREADGTVSDVLRVAAVPGAGRARCRSSSRSATSANAFREIWSTLGRSGRHVRGHLEAAVRPARSSRSRSTGRPREKVDFLILGDGYTAAERGKFEKDARRLTEILFARLALQGAAQRLQRLGALPGRGGVRHLAPLDRDPPPLARRRDATTPSAPSATC